MSRSAWKGNFVHKSLIKNEIVKNKNMTKNLWLRSSTITEEHIGKRLNVHNGREFKSFFITREKVGYKMGEFSFTRKKTLVKKKNKKIKKSS